MATGMTRAVGESSVMVARGGWRKDKRLSRQSKVSLTVEICPLWIRNRH